MLPPWQLQRHSCGWYCLWTAIITGSVLLTHVDRQLTRLTWMHWYHHNKKLTNWDENWIWLSTSLNISDLQSKLSHHLSKHIGHCTIVLPWMEDLLKAVSLISANVLQDDKAYINSLPFFNVIPLRITMTKLHVSTYKSWQVWIAGLVVNYGISNTIGHYDSDAINYISQSMLAMVFQKSNACLNSNGKSTCLFSLPDNPYSFVIGPQHTQHFIASIRPKLLH